MSLSSWEPRSLTVFPDVECLRSNSSNRRIGLTASFSFTAGRWPQARLPRLFPAAAALSVVGRQGGGGSRSGSECRGWWASGAGSCRLGVLRVPVLSRADAPRGLCQASSLEPGSVEGTQATGPGRGSFQKLPCGSGAGPEASQRRDGQLSGERQPGLSSSRPRKLGVPLNVLKCPLGLSESVTALRRCEKFSRVPVTLI